MEFKEWLEMDLVNTIHPNERSKSFWVKHPNNLQQVDAWKKALTQQIYQFPLAKDSFIHFTLIESAENILANQIIEGSPVFAVSCSFGIWLPVVQFNHIVGKKEKLMTPADIKKSKKNPQVMNRMMNAGWKIPNFQEEICAIHFKTSQIPSSAHSEEVIWQKPIKIENAIKMELRDAIRILNNTPHKIGENDMVNYI